MKFIKDYFGVVLFIAVLVVGLNLYIDRVEEINNQNVRVQESR